MRGRNGFTLGDALIVLGVLSVGATLLMPALEGRRFTQTVAAASTDVADARRRAEAFRESSGRWPHDPLAGPVPEPLMRLMSDEGQDGSSHYRLRWTYWEVIHVPETPEATDLETDTVATPLPEVRERAGITVYSGDSGILASLLGEYGPAASFATDSSWTLVFPAR